MHAGNICGRKNRKKTRKKLEKKNRKTSVFQRVAHRLENGEWWGGLGKGRGRRADNGSRNECNILLAVLVSVKFRIWTNFAYWCLVASSEWSGRRIGYGGNGPSLSPLSLPITQPTDPGACMCPRPMRVRVRVREPGELGDTRKNRVLSASWHELRRDEDEMSNMIMMMMMMSHCCL